MISNELIVLPDCETLIKTLQVNKDMPLEQAVRKRAKGRNTPHRDSWRALVCIS
jgi:hypothetical protein